MEKPRVRCHKCNGSGVEVIQEDGGHRDLACYHCATTGWISDEAWQSDRADIASAVLTQAKIARPEIRDSDEDEGDEFRAAESGISVHEYRQVEFIKAQQEAIDFLTELEKSRPAMFRALVDCLVPDCAEREQPRVECHLPGLSEILAANRRAEPGYEEPYMTDEDRIPF